MPPPAELAPPNPVAPPGPDAEEACAWFDGVRARRAVECVDLERDADLVRRGGFWVVVGEFDGPVRAWRFADVERDPAVVPTGERKFTAVPTGEREPAAVRTRERGLFGGDGEPAVAAWAGPAPSAWTSSLDRPAYVTAVERVRRHVRAGDVYQVNVCRVLSAPLAAADGREPSARALAERLARGNPAPFSGGIHVPGGGGVPPVWVVTASPELYLRLDDGVLTSAPIKGTAVSVDGLSAKDRAENVMITDLVRNDLQRVCEPGSVEVTALLAVEDHPGLVHLVSTVRGRLTADVVAADDLWRRVLVATYPPGSVSGAPKSSALRLIADLEPVRRGPYCGAVGWIDADAGRAELAVGIRTFWWASGRLHFGTGAGITWGSDPGTEWAETELKARRLVALASSSGPPGEAEPGPLRSTVSDPAGGPSPATGSGPAPHWPA